MAALSLYIRQCFPSIISAATSYRIATITLVHAFAKQNRSQGHTYRRSGSDLSYIDWTEHHDP
jgi:hypothetical protein